MSDLSFLYLHVTLDPAHFGRIRALDRIPDVRCRGVQLASRERARSYEPSPADRSLFTTLVDGVYEAQPRLRLLRAEMQLVARARPDVLAFTRWRRSPRTSNGIPGRSV